MKRRLSRGERSHLQKRRLLLTFSLIALALVLAFLFLHTDTVGDYLIARLQDHLELRYDISLELARPDYNLLWLTFSARDVSLYRTGRSDLPPFVDVDEVNADLRLIDLLRGKLTLEHVRFEGLSVCVVLYEPGRGNLPRWPVPNADEGGSFPSEVRLSSLSVVDGSFSLEDAVRGLRFEMPEWTAEVTGESVTGRHSIYFSTRSTAELQFEDRELSFDQLEAQSTLDSSGLHLDSLSIRAGESRFEAVGLIPVTAEGQFGLEATVAVDSAQFSRMLGMKEPMGGFLQGQLSLGNTWREPQLMGRITGDKLVCWGFESITGKTMFQWHIAENSIDFEEAQVSTDRGSVVGEGRIALARETGRSQVSVSFAKVDVGWLTKQFGGDFQVASLASGEAHLSWPGRDLTRLNGKGSVSLSAPRHSREPGILPVNGSIAFESTEEESLFSLDDIEAIGIHLNGRIVFRRTEPAQELAEARFRGQVSGYVDEAGSVLIGIAAMRGAESFVPPVRGRFEFAADLNGTVNHPHASFTLQAPALESFGLQGIDLEVHGEIDPRMLLLSELSAEWRGGRANLGGLLEFGQREPEIDLTASVTAVPLRDLLAALGSPIPLAGAADVALDFSGSLHEPKIDFGVTVPDLRGLNERLGSLELKGTFVGAELDIPSIVLTERTGGSERKLTANGHVDFNSDTFRLEAEGRQLEISSMQLAKDWSLAGLLNVSLRAGGALRSPEMELELGLERSSVSGYALAAMEMNARLKNGEFDATLGAPAWGLSAQVGGELKSPYPMKLAISAKDTNVSGLPFRMPKGIDWNGSVTGELEAAGNISDWRSGVLSATLTDLRLLWNGVELKTLKPIRARYNADSLQIEEGELAVGGGSLHCEGTLPGEIVAISSLDAADLLRLFPGGNVLEAAGRLDLEFSVTGSLRDPNLSGKIVVNQASLGGADLPVPVTNLAINVSFDREQIALNRISAMIGGGMLQAGGTLPVATLFGSPGFSPPLQLSASLEEFPLESLGFLPSEVSGLATAQVELAAPDASLSSLAGSVAFGQLQLNVGNLSLRQEEPILLSLQNGQIWLERFGLIGSDSHITGTGGVDFLRPGALDLELSGQVSTSVLAELVENVESSGIGEFQLNVKNLPNRPLFAGAFSITGGRGLIPSHRLQIDDLDALIQITDNQLQVQRLAGDLNGGSFKLDGGAEYSGGEIRNIDLLAVITGVFVDWPEGLKTISDGVIAFRSREEGYLLDGELRVLEGGYREPINLESTLLQYLRTGRPAEVDLEPNPFLSGLAFNVGIETIEPIVVDNNLAEALLQGRVQLEGSYYRPGMIGTITVEPGGEVYLREKTYVIEYGAISFLEENRIRPDLNILARTRAQEYDVTLQAVGPLGNIKTSFSSEPALAEPDIISVLLTGRTLEELRGAEASVAKEQALSLLFSTAGGQLTRQAESAIGLTRVRIEPYLIAPESTPEARLTVGQDLTSDLRGIYSVNLEDSGDQIWVAEYDVTKRFRTRAIKQSDNTYRLDFNHQLRLGGAGRASLFPEHRRVGKIIFEGTLPYTESLLRDKFKVKTGQTYDFFKAQKGVERVQGLFRAEDLLEARIRLRRAESDGNVDLTLKVDSGPAVRLTFEGAPVPSDTKKRVRELWSRGVSDNQRKRESIGEIQRNLVEDGYVSAKATCDISLEGQVKHVAFRVVQGPRFRRTIVTFQGVTAFEEGELERQLRKADLVTALYLEPGRAIDFLEGLYRRRGHLDANAGLPGFVLDEKNAEARVEMQIAEGPLYRIGKIEFQGNRVMGEATLASALGVQSGDVYYPRIRGETVARLEEFYWGKGYNRAEISSAGLVSGGQRVDLTYQITENIQDIIERVEVSGQQRVSATFIQRQMGIQSGEVLDLERLSRARKNLYDTGAFSLVEIEPIEIKRSQATSGVQRPMLLQVTVRESVPHTINYGAFYDTDRGLGITGDYRNHNLLGNGRVFGFSGRYDADRRELRSYFSQPARLWFPLRTHASVFVAKEFRPSFEFDQVGFSFEEQAELREALIASLGFSFVKNKVQTSGPDPMFEDLPLDVGSVKSSFAWDTRDSFLDATRGHFLSNAFQYAPSVFGSDFPFIKYFGTYSRYFALTGPAKVPLGGGLERPRVIFATGVRVGLANGFDEGIISPTERFFAGGGTSIRGFKQDAVGPVNEDGVPVGGNALFIWNNEIRFPLVSVLDGVGFLDIGNVYARVSDFNPLEVRKAAGFGLRVRTPFFLVRVDYGLKLDRQPGEPRGALFFSIGQAF